MKRMLGLTVAIATMGLFACKNDAANHDGDAEGHNHDGMSQNASAEPKTENDLLFDEVVSYHDEAMPKMGKLRGYQKTVQARLDSLSGKKDAASVKLKEEYTKLLANLQKADQSMMEWMDSFQPEPDLPTKEDIKAYLEKEKTKAKTMRDDIFAALDSAAAKIEN